MTRRPAIVLLLGLLLGIGCKSEDGLCFPGNEGCSCVGGTCLAGLECVADVCEPAGVGTTEEDTPTGGATTESTPTTGGELSGPEKDAQAACEALFACDCAALPYADVDACMAGLLAELAEAEAMAPGMGLTFDGSCLAKVAAALPGLACAHPDEEALCSLCAPLAGTGQLFDPCTRYPLGSSCAPEFRCFAGTCIGRCDNTQEGGYCVQIDDECADGLTCAFDATCVPTPGLDEVCNSACEDGLFCEVNTCSLLKQPHASCDGADCCVANYYCDGSECVPLIEAGMPCEVAMQTPCTGPCEEGMYCGPSNTCEPLPGPDAACVDACADGACEGGVCPPKYLCRPDIPAPFMEL